MNANLLALGAIALWASLAALGVALSHVPPFLLTGLGLLEWRVPPATLAVGVYGLFGFHFLLFIALRHAPPVQANLINYLWPLGIVVMAPLFLPGLSLSKRHVFAALLGFAGAALAILGGRPADPGAPLWSWGYIPAFLSAFIWASYSLLTKRVQPFSTSAIGTFALVSGVLALLCHAWLEPRVLLTGTDWALIGLLGVLSVGRGAQARRCAADWRAQLSHAAALHAGAAHAARRNAQPGGWAGCAHDRGCGGDGHPTLGATRSRAHTGTATQERGSLSRSSARRGLRPPARSEPSC